MTAPTSVHETPASNTGTTATPAVPAVASDALEVLSGPGAESAKPVVPAQPAASAVVVRREEPARKRPVAAMAILAALLLGFAADLALIGPVRHQRDQKIAFAEFRKVLAEGKAPVGQTDQTGVPLKLGTPVAVLKVPALGLTEVVREGTTPGVLRSGPGHRRDSVLPGQLGTSIIFGRQAAYGGPFRNISKLKAGDEIKAVTGQNEHTYRVIGPRRGGDPIPPRLAGVRGRLTLVTGDGPAFMPSGPLMVDADLVSKAKLTPARVFSSRDLPDSESAMGSDSGAWIFVVLWGQALVGAALAVAYMLRRWGRWQSWIVGVPVLAALGLTLADQIARLLPNLL